ncbi:pol polyprotein [Striga asiatica]|uniref:Pol polyprotein n=1 Tax=Striga asiatica TaxID=4170 RepID=A0A5A7Q1R2_STRAF|nr:pol polyprotein [Striga asiatica]
MSNGFNVINVHFVPLTHPYTVKSITKLSVEYIVKLHGVSRSIVSDRDRIFVNNFGKESFKMYGTEVVMSSAYHPQTYGQTESNTLGVLSINFQRSQRDFFIGPNFGTTPCIMHLSSLLHMSWFMDGLHQCSSVIQ